MLGILLQTILVAIAALWLLRRKFSPGPNNFPHVPIVGPRLSFLNGIKFLLYPQEMCMEGFKKYGGAPFRVRQQTGWIVLISDPQMAHEVLNQSDELMERKVPIRELLQIPYTIGPQIDSDQYHNDVIRGGLQRHLPDCAPVVLDEVAAACEDELSHAKSGGIHFQVLSKHALIVYVQEWTKVTVYHVATTIISRASNRLFIGLPLCRNTDYIKFTIKITFDIFNSANIINFLPKLIQPVVAPYIVRRKTTARQAAGYLTEILQKRMNNSDNYDRDYEEKPNDLLSWLLDEMNEKRRQMPDILSRLVFVNFASVLSTAMTLLRSIYDLVRHAEFVPELREEIEQVIEAEGFTPPALDKMYKLDSFVRESQRLTPLAAHTMVRRVCRDFKFSNGFSIPAGTLLALNQVALNLDEKIWSVPSQFDGFRYIDEDPASRLISTSNNLLFGHGRHVCAGRSLAVQELKAAMAYLIVNYDFKPWKASDFEGQPLPLFKLINWKLNVRKRGDA